MSENKLIVYLGVTFFITFSFSSVASFFAPDATAQKIAACMTQPNMEYIYSMGCISKGE
jgi:hypothetical protein